MIDYFKTTLLAEPYVSFGLQIGATVHKFIY